MNVNTDRSATVLAGDPLTHAVGPVITPSDVHYRATGQSHLLRTVEGGYLLVLDAVMHEEPDDPYRVTMQVDREVAMKAYRTMPQHYVGFARAFPKGGVQDATNR